MMRGVIVTRPSPDGEETCAALEQSDIPTIFSPLMSIVCRRRPAPVSLPDALAFTSANGVRAYLAQTWAARRPAYCVGPATAAAARRGGLPIAGIGADGVAALANIIAADAGAKQILHIRGTDAAGDLVGDLTSRGICSQALQLYKAAALPLTPMAVSAIEDGRWGVAFFSPRTVRLFADALGGDRRQLKNLYALCLSPAVADVATGLQFGHVAVAMAPTSASFVDMVRQQCP